MSFVKLTSDFHSHLPEDQFHCVQLDRGEITTDEAEESTKKYSFMWQVYVRVT